MTYRDVKRKRKAAHTCPACHQPHALKMDLDRLEVRCRYCHLVTWHMPEPRRPLVADEF